MGVTDVAGLDADDVHGSDLRVRGECMGARQHSRRVLTCILSSVRECIDTEVKSVSLMWQPGEQVSGL